MSQTIIKGIIGRNNVAQLVQLTTNPPLRSRGGGVRVAERRRRERPVERRAHLVGLEMCELGLIELGTVVEMACAQRGQNCILSQPSRLREGGCGPRQEQCSLQGKYRHENRGIPREKCEPRAPSKVSNFLTWEFISKRKFYPQRHVEMGPSSWDTSVFVPKSPRIVVPIVPERPPWRGRASIRSALEAHPGCLYLASLNFFD